MDKIRVVYLTTSYPMQSNPASGIFIQRLITHMPDWVRPLVVTPANQTSEVIDAREKIIPVKLFRYAPHKWQTIAHGPGGIPVNLRKNKFLYLLLPLFLLSEFLATIIISSRAQLIHANWSINGCIAGAAGILLNKPVVTTLHGDDITRAQHNKIDRFILWLCLKLNKKLISVNDSFRTWIIDTYPHFQQKITTIPNGIEDIFLTAGNRRKFNSSTGEIRLITIGSLIPRKGIDILIRAVSLAQEHISLSLTVVGEGHEKLRLEKLVKENHLMDTVKFVNNVEPHNIPELLIEHDIFVLASHSEGRPSVILEAMATAMPIIASDITGSNELILQNETGLLFTDNDFHELADCIKELSTSPELREKLGNKARQFIMENELLWSSTAAKNAEVYTSLLSQ